MGWRGPSGDYNSAANWSSEGVPNGANVILGVNVTGNTTVFTSSPISINRVRIEGAGSYALTGHGPVNLDAGTVGGGPTAAIRSAGTHSIQAPVNANVDTTVNVTVGAFDISGLLSLNGNTRTKEGEGSLSISNIGSGGGAVSHTAGSLSGLASVTDYTQAAGATYIATIGGNAGANVAGGHSQMVATGNVALDGVLLVDTINGFVPGVGASPGQNGDSFTIITEGTQTGMFTFDPGDSHVRNGIFYEVDHTASVTVSAFQALGGDADGDKDIDISDFNVLVQEFDPTGAAAPHPWTNANFDADDDVDITDFNSLVTNFNPIGYGDSSNAVPEPTGALLIGLGMLLLGMWGVRRSK